MLSLFLRAAIRAVESRDCVSDKFFQAAGLDCLLTVAVDVTEDKIQKVGVSLSDIQLSGVALLEPRKAGSSKVSRP